MSPDAQRILAALDRRRDKLARWMGNRSSFQRQASIDREIAAHRDLDGRLENGWDTEWWYQTYRRPSEAEQIRLHGRMVGPVGSGIERVGIHPHEELDWELELDELDRYVSAGAILGPLILAGIHRLFHPYPDLRRSDALVAALALHHEVVEAVQPFLICNPDSVLDSLPTI